MMRKKQAEDIKSIDRRIAEFKQRPQQKHRRSALAKYWENGVRIAAEFVAPIFIGISIGYLLDKWFDTRIIFMLILAIFGLAAGILNVYRAAGQMEKELNEGSTSDGSN